MFVNPEQSVMQLGLMPGMIVADLGCGTGMYSLSCAPRIASGAVYAIEIQKGLVNRLANEAKFRDINNIHTIWGDVGVAGGTKLADASVDVCIVSNILFQIENKENFLKEITRIIKKGGKVLIVDWSDSFNGMGPAGTMVITKEKAHSLFSSKGFIHKEDIITGDHHYGIIFTYEK